MNRKLNIKNKINSKNDLRKFDIKQFDCEKDCISKVVNIETLEYIPMCKNLIYYIVIFIIKFLLTLILI